MTPEQVVKEAEDSFNKAYDHFVEELKKIRTGRAHPSMLDSVTVEAYGTQMPMIQVGTVTAPEAQMLQISPFDPNNIQAIVVAIRDNPSLGLNPSDDGRVIRVPIPPLNEERRRDIVKQLGNKVEDCMIALRQARHDSLGTIDQAKKDKDISEDEAKRYSDKIEEAVNKQKQKVEETARQKETEIMTV